MEVEILFNINMAIDRTPPTRQENGTAIMAASTQQVQSRRIVSIFSEDHHCSLCCETPGYLRGTLGRLPHMRKGKP